MAEVKLEPLEVTVKFKDGRYEVKLMVPQTTGEEGMKILQLLMEKYGGLPDVSKLPTQTK